MKQHNQSIFDYHLTPGQAFFIPAISEEIKHKQVAVERALSLSSNDTELLTLPRIQVIDERGKLIAELEHRVPLSEITIDQLKH